jgi:predicted PurR-regulated permease PerM
MLFFLRIPFSPLLGLFAGILELVPYAGPIIAAIPGILVAASVSPTKMLVVVVGYLVIQQAENHLLVPNIMKNRVHMSPLVIIGVVLAGSEMGGILGALLAVPLTTLLQSIFQTLRKYTEAL